MLVNLLDGGEAVFRRQRGFQTNHHFTFFAHFAGDFYAVGSVRVDEFLVLLVNLLDGGEAVGVGGFARGKTVFATDFVQGKSQVKAFACSHFRPQRIDFRRIAIHQVEHETLEVGRFGNVHRRAGGYISMRAVARAVCTGFEKLVQHIVFIGRDNQAADRQAHLFGNVSRANIAEVAARYAEADGFVIA